MNYIKSAALAVVAIFVVIAASLSPLTATAQGSSASLGTTPKKNYIADPGESLNDTLFIRNVDTTNDLRLYLRVIDFTYTDQGGTPKLFLDPEEPQKTWSAKPFLQVPETVVVPPGESISAPISVNVPSNQGAGSYYSAIVYSTTAPEGGNVGLAASTATLAFVSIPGEVNEDLLLKKFGAYDTTVANGEEGYRYILGSEPTTLAYTLENRGNVTASPVGSIILRDIFGRERNIENINPNESLALIGQTRTFTACIEIEKTEGEEQRSNSATRCAPSGLWPGLYTASLNLFYGQNGNQTQEIVKTTHFWYLPLWFVIAVIVLLLVAAYFIWRLVRKIKNRQNGKIKLSSRRKRR